MSKISYELAKQLKDAGFPQNMSDPRGAEGYFNSQDYDPVYNPSLSELIEACGEDFYTLALEAEWEAVALIRISGKTVGTEGKTPEEAVAKLYIALHG